MIRPIDRSQPSGFTLVDVLIALSIGSLLVLGARSLFSAVIEARDRAAAAVSAGTVLENVLDQMRRAVRQAEPSLHAAPAFVGNAREAAFYSWCDDFRGFISRCQVSIRVQETLNGPQLIFEAGSVAVMVQALDAAGGLRYLDQRGSDRAWSEQWKAGSVPGAIAVVGRSDTAYLPVGTRNP